MTTMAKYYDYVFKDLADPRSDGWLFVDGPWFTLTISALYLYAIYIFLPKYMEDRKPYKLKTVIRLYNILQVVACTILIYGLTTSGWTTYYSMGCQPVDYSPDGLALRMLKFTWWTFVLKMFELVETVFFILRKKYNQVSKLHVYHHVSSFMLAWILTRYIGGGMASFPVILNCFIHVLMYTYYLLASMGPKMQKRIAPWKPKLTMLQMIQFCIIILHGSQALHPDCHVPKNFLWLWVPNVLLIFMMFYKFYQESYMKKCNKKS